MRGSSEGGREEEETQPLRSAFSSLLSDSSGQGAPGPGAGCQQGGVFPKDGSCHAWGVLRSFPVAGRVASEAFPPPLTTLSIRERGALIPVNTERAQEMGGSLLSTCGASSPSGQVGHFAFQVTSKCPQNHTETAVPKCRHSYLRVTDLTPTHLNYQVGS